MQTGDLIKFKGTWGASVKPGERQTGIVMMTWFNGTNGRPQTVVVLWDNGDSTHTQAGALEVINGSR